MPDEEPTAPWQVSLTFAKCSYFALGCWVNDPGQDFGQFTQHVGKDFCRQPGVDVVAGCHPSQTMIAS